VKTEFIELVKSRSIANAKSFDSLYSQGLLGNCLSILRQELDSFVRILYLGRVQNIVERERLMKQTINGERWERLTSNGKWRLINDKEMVDKASELKGYVEYVYKFGCAFIHLSNFHNYKTVNPFDKLNLKEKYDIKRYLNQYHGQSTDENLTVDYLNALLPEIFKKVSSNMHCYFDSIINDEMILI